MKVLVAMALWMISIGGLASEQNEKPGFLWYGKPEKEPPPMEKPLLDLSSNDPMVRSREVREFVEQKMQNAITRPTKENVAEYIEVQNAIVAHSERFSKTWQQVLRERPELDLSAKNPTNQIGRNIEKNQQAIKLAALMADLREHYGLMYFFAEGPYSSVMSEIVSSFSEKYNIGLLGVSLDGANLDNEKIRARVDNGIAAKLKVPHAPAVYAINAENEQWFPIAFGMVTFSDLEERILEIIEYKVLESENTPLEELAGIS